MNGDTNGQTTTLTPLASAVHDADAGHDRGQFWSLLAISARDHESGRLSGCALLIRGDTPMTSMFQVLVTCHIKRGNFGTRRSPAWHPAARILSAWYGALNSTDAKRMMQRVSNGDYWEMPTVATIHEMTSGPTGQDYRL